MNYDFVG